MEIATNWESEGPYFHSSPIIYQDMPLTSLNLSVSSHKNAIRPIPHPSGLLRRWFANCKELYTVNYCHFWTPPTNRRWEGPETPSNAEIQALCARPRHALKAMTQVTFAYSLLWDEGEEVFKITNTPAKILFISSYLQTLFVSCSSFYMAILCFLTDFFLWRHYDWLVSWKLPTLAEIHELVNVQRTAWDQSSPQAKPGSGHSGAAQPLSSLASFSCCPSTPAAETYTIYFLFSSMQ